MKGRLSLTSALLFALLFAMEGTRAENATVYKHFYTNDGSDNNPFFSQLGSVDTPFRIFPIGSEDGQDLYDPNPRTMCNAFGRETEPNLGSHLSMLGIMFGQFVNHDLEENAVLKPQERVFDLRIPIESPEDSLCFPRPPVVTEYRCDNLSDSNPNRPVIAARLSDTYTDDFGRLRVNNLQTAFFDLSHVYGKTEQMAQTLRGENGRLLTEDYSFGPFVTFTDLLPSKNTTDLDIDTLFRDMDTKQVFTQADPRVPENVALNMFHLLFTREHNYWAGQLAQNHSDWTSDEIYEEAKKYTIAIYQQIMMYEYLPALIGDDNYAALVPAYEKYRRFRDPSTSVAFATGALRYGHDSINPYAARDECGETVLNGIPFPSPGNVLPNIGQSGGPLTPLVMLSAAGGYENVIRGLVSTPSAPIDMVFNVGIGDIANNFGGVDLCALDIARGRENGLPKCYDVMKGFSPRWNKHFPYGNLGQNDGYDCKFWNVLSSSPDPFDCFLRLVRGNTHQANILRSFSTKVRDLDAFLCIQLDLDDPNIPGPTLSGILADEFIRKRDGDRFWFENKENWKPAGSENGDEEVEDEGFNFWNFASWFADQDGEDDEGAGEEEIAPPQYYVVAKQTGFKEILERNFNVQVPDQPLRPQPDYLDSLVNSCTA